MQAPDREYLAAQQQWARQTSTLHVVEKIKDVLNEILTNQTHDASGLKTYDSHIYEVMANLLKFYLAVLDLLDNEDKPTAIKQFKEKMAVPAEVKLAEYINTFLDPLLTQPLTRANQQLLIKIEHILALLAGLSKRQQDIIAGKDLSFLSKLVNNTKQSVIDHAFKRWLGKSRIELFQYIIDKLQLFKLKIEERLKSPLETDAKPETPDGYLDFDQVILDALAEDALAENEAKADDHQNEPKTISHTCHLQLTQYPTLNDNADISEVDQAYVAFIKEHPKFKTLFIYVKDNIHRCSKKSRSYLNNVDKLLRLLHSPQTLGQGMQILMQLRDEVNYHSLTSENQELCLALKNAKCKSSQAQLTQELLKECLSTPRWEPSITESLKSANRPRLN